VAGFMKDSYEGELEMELNAVGKNSFALVIGYKSFI